jgi:hypothetical protein
LPTYQELVCSPELGALAALDATLAIAIIAVVAAQPEMHATPHGRDAVSTPTAVAADHLIARAQALAAAIADYRTALGATTPDFPF